MTDSDQQLKADGADDDVPVASNAETVSRLFREHNRVLVGFLTARLRSEQEAKDVAQEAYVRLLQLQNPGAPSLLRAYLFKTAANLAIDRLRHRRVRDRTEERSELFEDVHALPGDSDDPVNQLLVSERTDQLLGFLQELPTKCQQVFGLHRLEGVPQREVAAQLGLSDRMVRRYVTYVMVYCHLRSDGLSADQVRRTVSL